MHIYSGSIAEYTAMEPKTKPERKERSLIYKLLYTNDNQQRKLFSYIYIWTQHHLNTWYQVYNLPKCHFEKLADFIRQGGTYVMGNFSSWNGLAFIIEQSLLELPVCFKAELMLTSLFPPLATERDFASSSLRWNSGSCLLMLHVYKQWIKGAKLLLQYIQTTQEEHKWVTNSQLISHLQ